MLILMINVNIFKFYMQKIPVTICFKYFSIIKINALYFFEIDSFSLFQGFAFINVN